MPKLISLFTAFVLIAQPVFANPVVVPPLCGANPVISTSVMTNASGAQVSYLDYAPFGETVTDQSTLAQSKRYTGKELDASTGLYDYSARHYDPVLGRFISADTGGIHLDNPQSLNRYSYCVNNPLKYVDPSGHTAEPWDMMFLAADLDDFQRNPGFLTGAAVALDALALAAPVIPAVAGLSLRSVRGMARAADIAGHAGEAKYVYDVRVGNYRDLKTGKFIAQRDLPYPSNSGFQNWNKETLQPGTIIDRYGETSGRYAGKPGATISERGMPPGSEDLLYQQFEVIKPIDNTKVGPAARVPEFGAKGGSSQYYLPKSIDDLLGDYLKVKDGQ